MCRVGEGRIDVRWVREREGMGRVVRVGEEVSCGVVDREGRRVGRWMWILVR